MFLLEKDLVEKAAATKIIEYSPLGKELKAHTDISRKPYQALDKIYETNKTINKKH